MLEVIQPLIGRLVASWVGALAIFVSAHFGVTVDAGTQSQLATGALAVLFGVGSTVYAVIHHVVDTKVLPKLAAATK